MCHPCDLYRPKWVCMPGFPGPHTALSICVRADNWHTISVWVVVSAHCNYNQTFWCKFLVEVFWKRDLTTSLVGSRSEFLHSLWWLRSILQDVTFSSLVVPCSKIGQQFSLSWLVQFSFCPYHLSRSESNLPLRNVFHVLERDRAILRPFQTLAVFV